MARRSSTDADIDPDRIDVLEAKPRKRRRRKVPPPSEQQAENRLEAEKRVKKMPVNPGVMLESQGLDEGFLLTAPHSDSELWNLQLAEAFGTRSNSIMDTFIRELIKLCPDVWDEQERRCKPDETMLNAAVGLVADIKPANAIEAALAAQMVAVHRMQINMSASALNGGGYPMEREAAIASKLARTFAQQLDTLNRLRGKSKSTRQTIKVSKELHQHVHYHHHRGEEVIDGESHAPSGTDAAPERTALPGPDSEGRVMPKPNSKGTETVPDARGKEQGRPKG